MIVFHNILHYNIIKVNRGFFMKKNELEREFKNLIYFIIVGIVLSVFFVSIFIWFFIKNKTLNIFKGLTFNNPIDVFEGIAIGLLFFLTIFLIIVTILLIFTYKKYKNRISKKDM